MREAGNGYGIKTNEVNKLINEEKGSSGNDNDNVPWKEWYDFI